MGFRSRMRRLELSARTAYSRQLVHGPDDPEAIPYLEAAIRRFPEDAELRILMADAYQISRPEQVAPEAKRAAELAPTNLKMQVYAGWRLVFGGDAAAARDCVARVRELAGDDYAPITDLVRLEGMIAAHELDFAAAEEKLRWAVETEPENVRNAHSLATFLWARGRSEEALATIDEGIRRADDGRFQNLLDLRAIINEQTEQPD